MKTNFFLQYTEKRKESTMKKIRMSGLVVSVLMVFAMGIFVAHGFCEDAELGNSMIKINVEPGIIAMPENNAAKVPIEYARIRSTALRNLNEIYGVKSIEKVFNIVKIGNRPPEKIEVGNTYFIHFGQRYEDLTNVSNDYESLSEVISATSE